MNLYGLYWQIIICIGSCLIGPASSAADTEYIIHNRGYTATIQKMLTTTIERSLELTRNDYGDFIVTEYGAKLSGERI